MVRLAASALVALVLAPAAAGFTIAGERWPGTTISVWNTTGYTTPLGDAMKAWNAAGANVRLVPATDLRRADVVIRFAKAGKQGESTVGSSSSPGTTFLPRGLRRIVATALATHELGHVLGLGHEPRGCAVMAPVVNVGSGLRCGIGACKVTWRCLVRPDDARGLRAIYGSRTSS